MTRHANRSLEASRNMAAEIRALHDQGLTGKAISERVGCSGAHVSKTLYRSRMETTNVHVYTNKWTPAAKPTTCQEWVRTPDGLRPCGADKHKLAGERMGQCREHYEAQRPMAGKMRGVS